MNVEAVFRYILTALLIAGVIVLMAMERPVAEWLIALVSGATMNTFRLQFTKQKD